MLSMDADLALRERFDAESDDDGRPARFRHHHPAASLRRDMSDATERASHFVLNNGVGWIQVLRPGEPNPANPDGSSPAALCRDELAPARGIVFGIVFGASLWAMIAGLVSTLLF